MCAALLPLLAAAQATVQSTTPAANATNVSRAATVQLTLNGTIAPGTMSNFRVFSAQRGGKLAGTYTRVNIGNRTMVFDPTTDFQAGEVVQAVIPSSVRSVFDPAVKRAYQFTTETAGGGTFSATGSSYATNAQPNDLAVADLDGDGDLDFATADAGYATLSVWLNSGTGSFPTAAPILVGSQPRAVKAADVDADGDLDLLAALASTGQVQVMLNDGTGAFTFGSLVTVGSAPNELAIGDFDADGDLDFAVANANSTFVSVALNTGSGTFGAAASPAVGAKPYGLAVGDVDNDGDLDLVTSNNLSNTATVLLNDDNGTFTAAASVGVGNGPWRVALADLDDDQDLDVVTANATGGSVSVRLNDGSGAFSGTTNLAIGGAPQQVAVGDFDGDADLDLAVADQTNSRVALRLNNGSGSFSGSATVAVDASPTAVALADVSGDGALDLLTPSYSGAKVSVRLNQIPAPIISSLTPNPAVVGGTVVLTGANFTGVTAVAVNGVSATYTVGSPTQISLTVPASATSGPVTVTTGYGTGSSAPLLIRPDISSFTPTSGSEGGGVAVITGTSFSGATAVRFNGTAASSYTVNSATQITATVPVGASSGTISVTTASGTGTSSGSFTVVPGVSAFSPSSGAVGTSVSLTGDDFLSATVVRFNGVSAAFTINSATSITATVPAGATTGLISVTSAVGTRSSTSSFVVTPGISSFTPLSGTAGTSVTITGTTFTGATSVKFGGTAAASFVVNSSTRITAVVASGTSSGTISVTTPSGTATSSTPFTLPPTLTSFSPASGVAGATFTLTGTNFIGATGVTFNGVTATFSTQSNTKITASVPATALSGPITVTSPAGSATSATSFVVIPALTASTPGSGVVGTVVTITGTNLTNLTGVSFNGTAATSFTLNSVTQLTVPVPAGATTGTVTATVSGTTASLTVPFQVRTATVVATTPAREALQQALSVRPAATFSQTQAGGAPAAGLNVYSAQRGGKRAGSLSGSGTFTSTFTPTLPFRAGERVQVTAPGAAGGVWQFRTAATGTGNTHVLTSTMPGLASTVGSTSGDIDNDGDLDLVVTSRDFGFRVLRNDGTGEFTYWQAPNSSGDCQNIRLADMNGDGYLDAVVGTGQVLVYLNNGTTGQLTYASACSISGGSNYGPLDVGDADGDGDLDVVAGNDDSASICYNDGTGTLTAVRVVGSPGDNDASLWVGPVLLRDVDNDGDLDLIRGEGANLVVYPNQGNGTMGTALFSTSVGGMIDALLGDDFDGDGDVDIVESNMNGATRLFANDGTGQLTLRSTINRTANSFFSWAAAGDVDADGDLDLITGFLDQNDVAVVLNDGTGLLTLRNYLTIGDASTGTLGDFDGDNDLDVMAYSYSNSSSPAARVFLNGRPPTITAFTPYGAVGATVTLTGTEFSNISGLTLNGTSVASYTRVSSTQVTFAVPAGATSGPISITTAWGTATTSSNFTVVVPGNTTVSGLSPASGPVGTSVTITGTAFTGASSVTFNGVSAAFTLNSTTQLTATVPATATTGPVVVTAAANAASSGISFTVTPEVSSFSPGSGIIGATVVLTGTGLTGATDVTFNSVSASFVVNSATQITATVPATAATGVLRVTTAGGAVSSSASFTVLPTLTSFTPTSGPEGTSVVVSGTGLTGTTGAAFNGTAVTTITAQSATSLTLLVPAGATTGPVSVTTAGGTATSSGSFTVSPTLTAFSPGSGPTGSSVTLTGTTLTGATDVTFNGVSAPFVVNSATQITAIVPATAVTGIIRVTTPGGSFSTSSSFTVLPTLSSFAPGSGAEGASVTISGTGLGGAMALSFNGTAASFTINSVSQLTAVVPAGATTGPISVTTAGGTATSSSSFTVTPTLTAFSPGSGPAGTSVTLTGTTLTGATAVTFGGVAASSFTVNSATSITAIVPTAAVSGVIRVTTPGGSYATTASFLVTPGMLAFSPASGPVGTSVTITGTALTGATAVQFNGISATYSVVNSTTITATVPGGSAPGPVTVTTPSGAGSSAASFVVTFPVTAVSPTRHALAVSRAADVGVSFTEPVASATAANVRVFSAQRGGRRGGSSSASGSTLNLNPTLDFQPGELVSVSVPAGVTSVGGAPATPHVHQFTAAAGPAPGGFGLLNTLSMGGSAQPIGTALADLDGDGDLDLATAALGLSQVLVQLNNGSAGFGAATAYATGNAPADVTAADVDNDGDLDLLTPNSIGSSSVSVLLNNGAGTFAAAAAVAVDSSPAHVVAADVNGDGWLDLLVPNASTSSPSVAIALNLGTGAGTFAAATTLASTGRPQSLAVADLDLDGDLDFALADRSNSLVRWALNDGTGSFAFSGGTVAVGSTPYAVALADLNADGRPDLATANNGAASLSVALATGAATFGTAGSVTVPASPYALSTGDVDGDGDLDLITAHNSSPGAVSVRLNNSSGTAFSGSGSLAVGNAPYGLALGDLDGNLTLDAVTADRSGPSVSVLLNVAPPTFAGFTPTSGPEGTLVTITGTNLTNTSTVRFNGTAATSFTAVSATQVTATVPAGATTGPVSLTALGNTVSSSGNFTVTPTITAFTPATGPAGTSVVISGTTLTGATSVRFNGVAAASFTVNSATQVTAVAPAGVTTGYLSLTTAAGSASSATVFGVPPTISSFTPGSAVAGTVFTLTGLNFTGATAVSFNGTAASSFTVLSDTQLQATLPVGTSSGPLSVTTLYGTGTSAASFTLLPSIFSFSPSSGPVATRVYLTGDGLTGISGAAGVKFNGTNAASYTVTSANALNAAVAINSTSGPITVVTSAGTLTSATSFTVTTGTPAISSLTATSGPVGTVFVVGGSGFLTTGPSAITGATVNGVAAAFVRTSLNAIQVTVPAGASGTGYVTLTNASGSSQSGQTFTVLDIFTGTLNQCLTTNSIQSTGGNTWQWLLAPNGQLVAALNDGGKALGTVYAEYTLNGTAVRNDARGVEYLDRNWHLVAQNGFTGSSVQVRFYGLNTELTRLVAANDNDGNDVNSVADLRLTQYVGNNENCDLADNTSPTSQRLLTPTATESIGGTSWFSVTASVADHFSEFYLNGGSSPLPVELTRFGATRKSARQVDVAWATASEKNSAGFLVERSADGRTFAAVSALVAGAGSSPAAHSYGWRDEAAPASLLYYRLRQVDLDGTVQFSPVAVVAGGAEAATQLLVYPNPAGGHATVQVTGPTGPAALVLLDALGRPVWRGMGPTLELPGLAAGVYTLRCQTPTETLTRKLVVE
ncbi:FG-GAP-like repeat-containing protein [Hymenobacter daecheongensis]|uniref:FG-GAP-like repeat-containing protein n=1 Tax=Hymenobacter daecheongensis TaxID=496053 RepID=UPI000934A1A3|nr:FG-GAP-like repeat-containing protein [Hymenobacter daecheongensis]